ncbi:phosphotransferase [Rhodanobacter lindaniclasticus]
MRQNSSIGRLRCAECGAQIVAKASQGRNPPAGDGVALREEYETLRALQPAFHGCTRYGTLEPLGFLAVDDGGVMVTRLFHGEELERRARKQGDTGVREVFWSAGVWLRRLHEAGGYERTRAGLEVDRRRNYLRATYGTAIDADRKVRAACELLGHVGRDVDSVVAEAVRLHGDFKPGNLLCNATRYVGLDIQWKSTSVAVYDLAPFMNHLWIATLGGIGSRSRHRHELAETAFLAGFGDVGDVRALRWVQLYFALCYWGGCRQRGGMWAAGIARWQMLPLVEMAVAKLRAVT